MDSITKQIRESALPYPQRRHLELEINQDFASRSNDSLLSESDLNELIEIHSTWLYRYLRRFAQQKKTIETVIAFIPLTIAATLISKEGNMIDFIREGGVAMYAILVIGGFMLLRELQHVVRLLIEKDHSKENLRLDTPSVLIGGLALICLGLGPGLLGIYVAANGVITAHLPNDILVIGIKESLAPVILSALLAALVIFAHYGTRRVMHIWRAPVAD